MELGHFWWWVVLVLLQFGINGCFGCWEQERTALLQLEASMINYTDEYSNYFTSWDSPNKESDCCDWERVKCNITTGRVIGLIGYSMGCLLGKSFRNFKGILVKFKVL